MLWKKTDLGTSIRYGRDWLVYQRNGREMTITIEAGAGAADIFADTIGRWDDAPDCRIGEVERAVILKEIELYLTKRGLSVKILPDS